MKRTCQLVVACVLLVAAPAVIADPLSRSGGFVGDAPATPRTFSFRTPQGRTFRDAQVVKVEAGQITFRTARGLATIPRAWLPAEINTALPAAAAPRPPPAAETFTPKAVGWCASVTRVLSNGFFSTAQRWHVVTSATGGGRESQAFVPLMIEGVDPGALYVGGWWCGEVEASGTWTNAQGQPIRKARAKAAGQMSDR